MPSIEAGICNAALLRVGQLQGITALTDNSAQAKACKKAWDLARDETLEAFAWPWAMKRQALTAITDGERGAWAYAYPVPNDCIAVRYLDVADEDNPLGAYNTNPGDAEQLVWRLESDEDTGRPVILTNVENAVAVYTAKVMEPARWSPMFRGAMAYRMASDLGFGLAKSERKGFAMMQAFERAVRLAAASSFNQEQKEQRPESELILSRGG